MRLKSRKQSMRQVTDSAAIERVALLGDIALTTASVPGNTEKPRFYRGALIKSPPRREDDHGSKS